MSRFFRFLAKLFDPPATKLEDIVFERLDGDAGVPSISNPPRGMQISLQELVPRVSEVWIRSGGWSLEQMIVLPPEAFMEGSPERPMVVSLRFLAALYPEIFKDPGLGVPDPGVDVPMQVLRETSEESLVIPVPAEVLNESALEGETFRDWEEDQIEPAQRKAEARETAAALRGVRLPRSESGERELAFESTLDAQSQGATSSEFASSTAVSAPAPAPPSNRLRKILAAYAEGLPASTQVGEMGGRLEDKAVVRAVDSAVSKPLDSLGSAPDAAPTVRVIKREIGGGSLEGSTGESVGGGRVEEFAPVVSKSGPTTAVGAMGGYQMRFEELGLSLSRFSEVKGFAFWQGGQSSHTGDLGFDLELATLRMRLERLLEGAVQVQGAQDGFSSVTFHHARGGMSVFGSGSSLVAVAHQHDGLPSHLRAWMCGWVAQPLRG